MTKEEALAKIKELEEYIKELENKVGFEDDELFLLSAEEYDKYKDVIPKFNCWWYLRSPGLHQNIAAFVTMYGSVTYNGFYVNCDDVCVRPALHLKPSNLKIGQRFIKYDFPWIYLGDNLAIAEVPIATHRFDKKSNDYATSEIRQFLKKWKEDRDNDV